MNLARPKKSLDVERAVSECKKIAGDYIANWKPLNSRWKTLEGAAYLRLSTDEQVIVEKGSLEQQVHMAILEADARSKNRSRNYKITKFFIEPGISGSRSDRREFLALKKAIRHGHFKFVTFKEISRIARDSQIWKEFFKLCHQFKCEIVLRGLPIDPNDPGQILQLDILAVFAEYEAKVTAKRIRESVFSAMVNSGKFNSTHRILGFSALVINGQKRVGFYQPNEDELTIVRWIMDSFVKYGSHYKVLEMCREKKIKNWNGRDFERHSLHTLLTNPRYIGKWYLNQENENIESDDPIPDHQRFHEIDLPHGPVISMDLWRQVQNVVSVVAGNLGKNTRVNRVYPLSGGMLRYHDGSVFRGCSGTGKTTKSYYYFNQKHGLRIPCEIVERDTVQVVSKIIQNSPDLQTAIRHSGEEAQDRIQFQQQHIKDLKREMEHVNDQKSQHLQKMNLLIADSTPEEIRLFKAEFAELIKGSAQDKTKLEEQIRNAEREIVELKDTAFSWASIGSHAQTVQERLIENDPVALKRAYYSLFSAIILGPEDGLGNRKLTYVLKNSDEFLEDEVRLRSEMVEAEGIEPSSVNDPY